MSVSKAVRKKTATVHRNGKDEFPIPDKKHATLALDMINRAKPPLSSSEKAAVRKRAAAFGSHSATDPSAKKGSRTPKKK
jgi:hypothetical protein